MMSDDEYQIRLIVTKIYRNILQEYIAPINECELLDKLYDFYTNDDSVTITRQQFEIYKKLETYHINTSVINPNKLFEGG